MGGGRVQLLRIEPESALNGEFSVCQFFKDGLHEYVRRFVGAEEAVKARAG